MSEAYLPRVAAGDRGAMQQCIERYSQLVWSLALRLSPSRADAEDAVQEVFLNLWQNAARFDPARASEPTFVALIARRRLVDRLRKDGRAAGRDAAPLDPDLVPGLDDPERSMEARVAARALTALPADRREVVALSVVAGLTQEEIASRTRLPLGTVKSHLRRGLLAVRAALAGAAVPRGAERSSR